MRRREMPPDRDRRQPQAAAILFSRYQRESCGCDFPGELLETGLQPGPVAGAGNAQRITLVIRRGLRSNFRERNSRRCFCLRSAQLCAGEESGEDEPEVVVLRHDATE